MTRTATVADLLGLDPPPDWHLSANCATADPDLFHRDHGEQRNGPRVRMAKRICGGCPVRDACLAEAIANEETHGVWGGLDEHERAALTAQRKGA